MQILPDAGEQGRQEGILLGEQNGGIKMLYKLIKNGTLTMDEAVKQSGVTREEFLKIAARVSVPV